MSKRRRLLIFVVFILVALASIRIGSIHPVGMSIWQLLLAIGGVYLFVFYCQRYSFIESDQNVPFCQVPQDRASRLQVFAGGKNRISARQAKIFAMSIVTPTEMRQRLVETYVLEHRTIRQRVSIEVQIPVQLESDPK